jgi:hypothetical protein
MAADLQAVDIRAHVVGVMDGPARQPQDLALKLGEQAQVIAMPKILVHRGDPVPTSMSRRRRKEMPIMADYYA